MITIIGILSVGIIVPVMSQELITDKIFTHEPKSSLYEYRTYYNGTLLESTTVKQIVIYKWNQLSDNAKKIIIDSMELQGYRQSGIGEHEPQWVIQ